MKLNTFISMCDDFGFSIHPQTNKDGVVVYKGWNGWENTGFMITREKLMVLDAPYIIENYINPEYEPGV